MDELVNNFNAHVKAISKTGSDVIDDEFANTFYDFTNKLIDKLKIDFDCDDDIMKSYTNIMHNTYIIY